MGALLCRDPVGRKLPVPETWQTRADMNESRAIAAFAGLGVVLVGFAVVLARMGPRTVGPGGGTEATPPVPAGSGAGGGAPGKVADFPGDIPEKFSRTHDGWDYVR